MPFTFVIVALAALALAACWALWRRPRLRRQLSLTRLLDLADEVEDLLNRSQQRMTAMQALLQRVPSDIGAVAQASLDKDLPILEAKRDVLQHRLWIQKHGDSASQSELDTACEALDRARTRIGNQLAELDRAGAELAHATDAADTAAQREPPTLRRPPAG
jgi:hypothetical protein